MNTEHVFQIAVSVDDEAIKQQALEYCAKEIKAGLDDGFFEKSYYSSKKVTFGSKMLEHIDNVIKVFIENHKEEIIEAVVPIVVDRILKTKAVKEVIQDTAISEVKQ